MGLYGQYLISEAVLEDLAHLKLLFLVGVVLEGEDDGRVVGVHVAEIGDGLDHLLETDRTGHREPVLHYGPLAAVLHQLRHTCTSISKQR